MKTHRESLSGLVHAAAGPSGTVHPSARELSDYHLKRLRAEDTEDLRTHLETCRECADLVLDLEELGSTPAEAAGLPRADPGAWASFQETLEDAAKPSAPGPTAASEMPRLPAVEERPWHGPGRYWMAVAASLLLVSALASAWLGSRLAGGTASAALVSPNVASLELFAEGALRGAAGLRGQAPAPGETLVLTLIPADSPGEGPHTLRLLRGDEEIWKGSGLLANDRGHFLVLLGEALPGPGSYALELAPEGGAGESMGLFRLQLDP